MNNWANSFLIVCLLKWSRCSFSVLHNDGWRRTCSNNPNKPSYSTCFVSRFSSCCIFTLVLWRFFLIYLEFWTVSLQLYVCCMVEFLEVKCDNTAIVIAWSEGWERGTPLFSLIQNTKREGESDVCEGLSMRTSWDGWDWLERKQG